MDNILELFLDTGVGVNVMEHITEFLHPLHEIDDIQPRTRAPPKKRNENYFEVTISKCTDDQFREHFTMSRTTFEVLLNVMGNHVGDKMHSMPNFNISLQKKLLFTIWLLSKSESFHAVGDRFNIPTSSGHGIFKSIVYALTELMSYCLKWPDSAEQSISSQIFEQRTNGISNVVGIIDSCHIPIKQPVANASEYYNRKQFHSIILQGVCDHTGRFIDVFIGMPGKMHDAQVFKDSDLFQKLTNQSNPLLRVEQHLVGDCAYPLMINLMTPFKDNGHLTAAHVRYNVELSSIRSIMERAFGFLKGTFQRLKYLDIADVDLGNLIIAACCVLHNFIMDNEEQEHYNISVESDDTSLSDDAPQYADLLDNRPEIDAIQKRMDIVNIL